MAELTARMRALVQPHLAAIEPYDPAFSPCRINLSANENTYPLPPGVRAAVDEALAATPLNRYPDPMAGALRDELAVWHGVARENICVGNGGDELLFNFLMAFGGTGRVLVNCPPAFSEYAFFASLVQTAVRDVPRDPATFELPVEELERAAADASLVILTSPNNPTGNLVARAVVERVCAACPGLVMVDEAYGEFAPAGSSALPLLAEHPNLVVLRTLSKAFGAAGIRLGYVIAAPEVVDVFAAVRQIYSVNVLTQAAATALVRARDAYRDTVAKIVAERERLRAGLAALGEAGVSVWPSAGNFLLVRLPRAAEVRRLLRDNYSILVRDFSATPGLEGCLRITVGTPEENGAVLAALRELAGPGPAAPACCTPSRLEEP